MTSHIEYLRFRHGENCSEDGCRARKFYIEDGKKFCQRGHEQIGFTQTQQDEDDWNSQGKRTRKKKQDTDFETRILRGSDARELHLQCFQLILWKQLHCLVKSKEFPVELETIVRDLWSLRMGFVHRFHADRSGYSSGTMSAMFSSSEGENTDTDGSGFKSVSSRRSRKSFRRNEWGKVPKLIETVTLIYCGILLLRLPISVGEITKWALNDEILYNRAIKEVPLNMRIRLPPSLAASLEVRTPLTGVKIHQSILQLLRFFREEFEIVFPPLNVPLLLNKHIRGLCLPVEIYPTTQRLSSMAQVDFTNDAMSVAGSDTAEIRLVSFIVIATKLCHPFDNVKCASSSSHEFLSADIDWIGWNKSMQDPSSAGLESWEALRIADTDVPDMTKSAIDSYMEWYQGTWLEAKDAKS